LVEIKWKFGGIICREANEKRVSNPYGIGVPGRLVR
jgi:hypothetical protein